MFSLKIDNIHTTVLNAVNRVFDLLLSEMSNKYYHFYEQKRKKLFLVSRLFTKISRVDNISFKRLRHIMTCQDGDFSFSPFSLFLLFSLFRPSLSVFTSLSFFPFFFRLFLSSFQSTIFLLFFLRFYFLYSSIFMLL